MAMRRADLDRVGGWRRVADVLAEDDVLGQHFRAVGYGVELCLDPIDNRNVACSVARSVDRHTRWAKMRRSIAPRCFALEPWLSPLAIASIALVVMQSATALTVWGISCALQLCGAAFVQCTFASERRWRLVAIEPLRVYVALACWARAWLSRRVAW